LLLVAAIYFGVRFYQQRTLVEGSAPALRAVLLDGASFDLAARRDAPVLVYFWATWCPVCRLEQGSIEALARDHRVVTVALQSGEPATVRNYLKEHGLVAPVINDPDGEIARVWGVRATPTLFFIDPDGSIRFRELGYTTEAGMRIRLWWLR
jgi:thiol-disulfide isomerase/thioredoxin